jgi:hypothetical protein
MVHVPEGIALVRGGGGRPPGAAPPASTRRRFRHRDDPRDGRGVRGVPQRPPRPRPCPLARGHIPPRWQKGSDGRLYPEDHGRLPVTQISGRDALAYCAWRAERDAPALAAPPPNPSGRRPRARRRRPALAVGPTSGSRRFCRCVEGPEGGALSSVGNPSDEGPYGVRDLAGGVREWTSTRASVGSPAGGPSRAAGFSRAARAATWRPRTFVKLDRIARRTSDSASPSTAPPSCPDRRVGGSSQARGRAPRSIRRPGMGGRRCPVPGTRGRCPPIRATTSYAIV